MRVIPLLATALISTEANAGAKIDFATYEGRSIIEKGEGGSRVTRNGIDYWTNGRPPRCYQVIGYVNDRRNEQWDGGHAVGSPRIAHLTKQAGGDAVILVNQNDVTAGSSGFGTISSYGWGGLFGSMFTVGGTKTMTAFVVVRYVEQCPDAPTAPVAPVYAAVHAPAPPPPRSQDTVAAPRKFSTSRVRCVTC